VGRSKKNKQLRKICQRIMNEAMDDIVVKNKWYHKIPILGPWLYRRAGEKLEAVKRAAQLAKRKTYQGAKSKKI
jgi:hypothetical protein